MTNRQKLVDARDRSFFEHIDVEFPYHPPKPKHCKSPTKGKILVLADPHEPYADSSVFDACERDESDAEVVIVPGDLGDYYSKSRFRKTRHQSFAQEIRAVFLRLEWLSQRWPTVKVMLGNHDNRPEKQIQNLMQADVELMILTEQNLITYLASFFENVEIVGTQIDLLGIGEIHSTSVTHIYQHGDIVFTHGEKSNANKHTLMSNISKYLRDWAHVFGLKPYSVIAQAHNHADLKMTMGSERWFLLPMAAKMKSVGMEYAMSSRMIGSPSSSGYSVFYQTNGKTDYNRSHNIVL